MITLMNQTLKPSQSSFFIDTDDGRLNGDHTSLNVVINDDPNDLPPYVFFNEENQYIDETDGDLVVTVNLSLHAGSGFQDPSIPIQVSTDPEKSTATASGTYADHNLVSRYFTLMVLLVIKTRVLLLLLLAILLMRDRIIVMIIRRLFILLLITIMQKT